MKKKKESRKRKSYLHMMIWGEGNLFFFYRKLE